MNAKIAVAQIDSVLGNIEANVSRHLKSIDQAKKAGAQIIVFPELSLTGYTVKDMNWDLALNVSKVPAVLQPLVDASQTISIIAGGIEEDDDFRLFNSAFLFEDGHLSSAHKKIYPPTYGMFEELRYFSKGESVKAIQTKHGRVGVLVCEDLWHLPLPYLLAQQGANVIIALVASPTRLGGNEQELANARVNMENHKAYARLLTTYLVFCNRVGYEDGVNFWGGSSVTGPDGETVALAKYFDEDLILGTVDDNEIRRARRFSRHFLDDEINLVSRELSRIEKNRS